MNAGVLQPWWSASKTACHTLDHKVFLSHVNGLVPKVVPVGGLQVIEGPSERDYRTPHFSFSFSSSSSPPPPSFLVIRWVDLFFNNQSYHNIILAQSKGQSSHVLEHWHLWDKSQPFNVVTESRVMHSSGRPSAHRTESTSSFSSVGSSLSIIFLFPQHLTPFWCSLYFCCFLRVFF